MEKIKIGLAALSGAVAAWLGDVYILMLLALSFMALDFLTGVMAAGKEHNINSQTATDGMYKKAGFFLLLLLGLGLDIAVGYFASGALGISMPFNSPFGLMVCAWIVFTEAISVTENLSRLNVPIPAFLSKWLKITRDGIDISGDDSNKEG